MQEQKFPRLLKIRLRGLTIEDEFWEDWSRNGQQQPNSLNARWWLLVMVVVVEAKGVLAGEGSYVAHSFKTAV
jgi:hypothetical protein